MYVTDTLWGIAHGKCVETRFVDLLKPPPPEEQRTPEEVREYMLQRLRGGSRNRPV